jgi:hypothetical protein
MSDRSVGSGKRTLQKSVFSAFAQISLNKAYGGSPLPSKETPQFAADRVAYSVKQPTWQQKFFKVGTQSVNSLQSEAYASIGSMSRSPIRRDPGTVQP